MEMNKGTMICQRAYEAEMRAENNEESNEHRIVGYAAVFEKETDIDGVFKEKIARGAFDGCKFKDVVLSVNHDNKKIPLARSRNNNANSTLQLAVDNVGLSINALLDTENNKDSAALYSATSRGDMGGMSFIFLVGEDRWENLDSDMPTRTITKIAEVYEVTAATWPYYKDTTLDARAKQSLESEKAALESARNEARTALESEKASKQCEVYKFRSKIGI